MKKSARMAGKKTSKNSGKKTVLMLCLVLLAASCYGVFNSPEALNRIEDFVHSQQVRSDSDHGEPDSINRADNQDNHSRAQEASAVLAQLPVKGRAPRTGYEREEFGQGWLDPDHNGCDTRNDILRRDLDRTEFRSGTHGCVVISGVLDDPYSGENIDFRKSDANKVQIDHVVALSDAWQKGAQNLSSDERRALANDPLNLLAVKGSVNAQKSDGDAATWLPPQRGYRCAYVARQIAVKAKYQLWVSQAEKNAMQRVLSACPDEPLPTSEQSIPPQITP